MTCDFADEPNGKISVRRLMLQNGDGSAGASATGSPRRFPSACPQVISTCPHVETNCAHLIQGPIFLIPNAGHLIHDRRLSFASLSRPVSTCPQLISNCAHVIQNPKKTIHKPGFPIPCKRRCRIDNGLASIAGDLTGKSACQQSPRRSATANSASDSGSCVMLIERPSAPDETMWPARRCS